jgi:FMN phosphatase YigB (HAD superfamily)
LSPDEIAYVGDRVDNDVRRAAAAGLVAVFIRRGPWGWIVDDGAMPREATLAVESLAELPEALRTLDGRAGPRGG